MGIAIMNSMVSEERSERALHRKEITPLINIFRRIFPPIIPSPKVDTSDVDRVPVNESDYY